MVYTSGSQIVVPRLATSASPDTALETYILSRPPHSVRNFGVKPSIPGLPASNEASKRL